MIAAPIHAVYRNDHGYEEGRNLYAQAAGELTREWRELTGQPLSAVSGDDSLAFATAFYSSDHPQNVGPFEYDNTLGIAAQDDARPRLDRDLFPRPALVQSMDGVGVLPGRTFRQA